MNAPKRSILSKSWGPVRTHAGIYTGGKVQLSHDSDILACLYQDDVAIVDPSSGELKFTLQKDKTDEEKEAILSFALRPKHNQLVTASRNSLLRLWDLQTLTCIRTIKTTDSPILCMDFEATGTLLATGASDRCVKIYDIEKGYCTHNFKKHTGIVTLVKFHPDVKRLQVASSSDDSTVRVWDLISQKQVACVEDHMNPATSIAFSIDGYTMLSAGRDKVVNIWDLRKQTLLKTVLTHEPIEGICVLPKPDGIHFVTGGEKGQLKHWKYTDEACTLLATQKKEGTNVKFTDLIYNTQRNEILGVTSEHNFLLFNDNLTRTRQIIGFNDDILSLKYIPNADGTGISDRIVAATNSEQIRVMHRQTLSCELLSGHSDIVMALAVSPDGKYLVSASKDGTARVWNLSTFKCIAVGAGHAESLGSIGISQKLHHYTSGSAFFVTGSSDKTMKVWNLDFLTNYVTSDDEPITLSAKSAVRAHDKDVSALAVAPNDRFVASGSQDKMIKIWNSSTLALMGTCRGHKRGIWSLEFSPVDQCLASASSDKTIKLWSLKDFSCLKTFEGHTASVLGVHFVCAGMQLLSAGADGLVKLWTIKTNDCEATFDHHEDKIWSLAVSKDSSEMITGGADSTIHFWSDFTQEENEKKKAESDLKIVKEQELVNCLRTNDYIKAVHIAFEIEHPFRLMQIFRDMKEGPKNKNISMDLNIYLFDPIIKKLSNLKIELLLEWIRDWNTNAKHSELTQLLLASILRVIPPSRWEKMNHALKILNGLIAYTERHFQRMEKILQKSYLIDFTIVSMQKLIPQNEENGIKRKSIQDINEIKTKQIKN